MLHFPTLRRMREPDFRFRDIYKKNLTEFDISQGLPLGDSLSVSFSLDYAHIWTSVSTRTGQVCLWDRLLFYLKDRQCNTGHSFLVLFQGGRKFRYCRGNSSAERWQSRQSKNHLKNTAISIKFANDLPMALKINNWFMISERPSNYGCTRQVVNAREKLKKRTRR